MKKIKMRTTTLTILCLLHAPLMLAKNVGVIGTVYPIAETDFLALMQTRVQEKIRSGELAHWQAEQIETIKAHADRPTPVTGLIPTQQNRNWLYDPTLTLNHDLLDAHGDVRLPAGTRLNPLDHVTWTKTLLFYDGDNAAQIAWAIQMDQQLKGQVILILTQGSIAEQTEKLQKRVYFDQGGQLVKRFGITHLPASVAQEAKEAKQLNIKEVQL